MVQGSDIRPWLREPAPNRLFVRANVVDVERGVVIPDASVAVSSDGRIESVSPSSSSSADASPPPGYTVIDCEGRYLCPGLFDAHVHFCAVPGFTDLSMAFGNHNDVSLLRQPYVASQMLHRGFTSVRDCGGAQLALKQAIDEGVFHGPRVFIAGHALSQYGGHGDIRGPHDPGLECCGGAHANGLGRLCNGVPGCMAAVREEVRRGADFIKIMASGGVSTLTDALDHLQFTADEIRAMVQCADNAGTFVTAHAYTVRAIRHCIDSGVRGIEHGNFVDPDTAALMARRGVYLTPTLITYHQMASPRWEGYLPPESQAKNTAVFEAGLQALETAAAAGVTMCYGSDLLGPLGAAQTREFHLRSRVLSSLEVLRSATVNPARMMGRADSIGQVKAGFLADLLLLDKNPLEDVSVLDDPETNLLMVMKEGSVYKSRWEAVEEDAQVPVRVRAAL